MYKCFFKRLIDFLIVFNVLLVIWPILLIITIWLHFANKGAGAFFFQERPGKDGKIFKVIKFKSMTDERDADGNLLPNELRITPIGAFIRKTSIDELPQLINVLKGDMALIGPRPLLVDYLPLYSREQARRHDVRPAFTGLSYVEVKRLYPSHIGTTADGRRFIRINRKKTNVESFIPLHPVAEQILSLYNTTDDGRPVFPLPNRNRLWYCIHEIGILAGVKENLSYHASRHSFGTLTLSAGVPIESISKMMGHTNIRTTQGYAKVTDDKISEDMDKLMEKRRKNLTDSGHDNQ